LVSQLQQQVRLEPRPTGARDRSHAQTGSAFFLARVAEARRFEPLRGCPQHAFQQCWPLFTGVRHRPRPARTRPRRPLVNGAGRR
jgi:hypothetical protein